MSKTTMQIATDIHPPIVIAEEDFERLSDVAEALHDAMPAIAAFLNDELARARIVPKRKMPADIVTMNSCVEVKFDQTGKTEKLKLVYPADGADGEGRVSIASPVGVALIGLREGQSISWHSRYGEQRSLTVLRLVPAED
ncbi:MAG: nucleoside diphosphate kinase regulator [Parvibaculum sp.]|uniref:nucleoside diphosphate kinase regulator n=1 Tax=Parvibaculum sp. TaxID=2024848 RepID=UPI00283ED861|nr:nucleoside diphosphate kinase regulator [Parvibaculum sp.]MDR3497598.1 nucleoside diphosphate kinase regulator [Parvibaculum sp.]